MNKLWLMMILCTSAFSYEDAARIQANKDLISKLKPYQCFAEQYMRGAEYDWQIPQTGHGLPYILVTKQKDGFLYAQPHPQHCENEYQPCFVYWLRTEHISDAPFFNMERVACPKHLTRKFIRNYIEKYYKPEIDIKVIP